MESIMDAKEKIVEIFRKNVKGRKPDVTGKTATHDGKYGHWLEQQFGIYANSDNSADLMGYELKSETTSGKTTFGDWSANIYIFNDPTFRSVFRSSLALQRRDKFLAIFGKPNSNKGGRYSWSGECCPSINKFNNFGQRLIILENNDIVADYCYSKDKRNNKHTIVPLVLQKENLTLARWYGNSIPIFKTGKCLREKVEDKFNQNGWFTCKKDAFGYYQEICFGKPLSFNEWIKLVAKGVIFFDSGMHQGNPRPYSEWRAFNDYWDSLIVERIK